MFSAIRNFHFIILLLASTTLTAAEASKEIEKAIKDISVEFTSAWNKHDAKKIAGFWTEDGDLLPPWSGSLKNRNEIEKHFSEEMEDKMKDSQLKLIIDSIRFIDPDTAFVDADMTITGMKVAGEPAAPFHDHGVFLFVKRNGKWQILIARPY